MNLFTYALTYLVTLPLLVDDPLGYEQRALKHDSVVVRATVTQDAAYAAVVTRSGDLILWDVQEQEKGTLLILGQALGF